MTGRQTNGYRKFFWLAATIGAGLLLGIGATFISLQVNSATQDAKLDSLKDVVIDLKSESVGDRVATMALISHNISEIAQLRVNVARIEQQLESIPKP